MQSLNFPGSLLAVLLASGLAAAEPPPGAVPLHGISSPALSPNGKSVVFEWIDDLWTAPAAGGEAKRLLSHPAYESRPRYSPDGSRILFSSDRSGSLQVFSVSSAGNNLIQHTRHTEGNELEGVSPDGTRALVRGIRENPGPHAGRLIEIDLKHERRERRLFDADAHSAAWSPDGSRVLFCRGGESPGRHGYRGAGASQIWLYQISNNLFECKVAANFEARSPLWLPDGKGFYFVSYQSGTANLWMQKDGSPASALTHYDGDGVFAPDLSADGSTIVFLRGLDCYCWRPEQEMPPEPVRFWTLEPVPDVSQETISIHGTTSADFSTNLDQVVFAAGGDLWWIDGAGKSPLRLTKTAAAEDELRFSPDGLWLYFLRDDGIAANYFRARFDRGVMRDESPVTRGTRSKCRFKPSPDGSKIAWVEGTGELFTASVDGSDRHSVFKCWEKPAFDWSPDGQWLAIAAEDRNSNRDISLVASDGSREVVNLTRHPGFEGVPKWSPDGRWLVFPAQWNRKGETQLWQMDFGKDGPIAELTIEAAQAIGEHATLVSTPGIEPQRVIWSADSKSLLFQSLGNGSSKLYSIGVDGSNLRTLVENGGMPIRTAPGGNLMWLNHQTPEILADGKIVRFPIQTTIQVARVQSLTLGFRRIWRTIGENFYDPKMKGCDWNALRLKYEASAGSARTSRQFGRIINQLMGELNSSHLSFDAFPWPGEFQPKPPTEPTAHPGWVFRDAEDKDDAPLRIERIIPGSPVAMLPDAPEPGDTIVRIAGTAVSNRSPLDAFFSGAENRSLPVVLRDNNGRERVIELRCISFQKAQLLEMNAREAALRKMVEKSNPGSAYLAVPNMRPETLMDIEHRIYQESLRAGSLMLDLRDNAGGSSADRMLGWFNQALHSFTVPRDGPPGYPMDRLTGPIWNKPLVVLCNQNTRSNAEIFCHAIQQSQRASLVGTTTPGCVLTSSTTEIPDIGELQVPFREWFHSKSGKSLEMNGVQPDHRIDLTPADENSHRDPQLLKALDRINN